MVSSDLSRRRVLLAGAGALTALAGCNGSADGGDRSTSTEPARGPSDPGSVPPHRRLRAATDDPLVWLPDETRTDADGEPRRRRPRFLTSREEVERLHFADADGADAARSFLEETAFDAATVFVQRLPVGECYKLQLCGVSWSQTEIDTEFGRVLRDASVACEAEARDSTAWLIRIPEALDTDRITGYGSGVGGGSCAERGRPPEPEPDPPITADAVPANATTEPASTEGDDA
ncbi:hypothetical protein GRX01_10865 [Halobaculum sp. WSA2]|uniref:Uncharacterized protein n=1 Tax=Halobaculum saliterrae TaxID=2073113 RepID=A0A6B0SSD0_9EURY|nr:hypothetical protein [Halobaculum saliterrae]MXR41834.1 hypothetical protein [Halobaculum saliterrae]